MHRKAVNKRKSAKKFNHSAGKTHPRNLHVMRGGYRL